LGMDEPEKFDEEEKPPIDDRIAELREQGYSNREIVRILYEEGYSTHDIMKRHLPLKALKSKERPERTDSLFMGALEGATKGVGYLEEFKEMMRRQIARSRELTEFFYNVGLGTLLASLRKSGMSMEDCRKIAIDQEGLKEALRRAGETAFKALEYYDSDLITKVEAERDEARAYASLLETKLEELTKNMEPKVRLERMIHTYLLSGNVDADVLTRLIDKWLSLEMGELKSRMVIA